MYTLSTAAKFAMFSFFCGLNSPRRSHLNICTRLRRRSMSLTSRMSNSSRITYAEPVKLGRWQRPSIQQRLSWPPLVHLNCFTWISSVLIIILLFQMKHLNMALLLLMITLDTHGYTLLLTNMKCRKSSNDFPRGLQPTLVWRSSTSEVTMELSSRIPVLMTILMNLVLLMNYLLLYSSAEWRRGAQEQNSCWDGSHYAWWIQNTSSFLDWGNWYCVPHHQ